MEKSPGFGEPGLHLWVAQVEAGATRDIYFRAEIMRPRAPLMCRLSARAWK